MLPSLRQVGAGSESGKSLKVVNEMGLIEIASVQRKVRPADGLPCGGPLQHLLKAPHPAEYFWGESDGLLKQRDEALGTHAKLCGHLRDGASRVPILQRGQREPDSRMWCVLPANARSQEAFEDANPLVVRPSRLQLFPQATGGSAEDARKIHDLVRQLGSRHWQKETRPAWLEADAQGGDHGGRINDGELGTGPGEHTAMKALKLIGMREVRDPKGVMAQIEHHRHLTSGKAAFLAGSL